MQQKTDELLPTRMTLIERLKQWDDAEGWREFFETYWSLIYGVAIKSGLSADEAQDVVQETVISVSKNIGKFKADPAFGSFKGWLLQLTRWRVANQFRKRPKAEVARAHLNRDCHMEDDSTATEEKIPDTSSGFDAIWDEEWEKNLLQSALEKLKRQVSAKHYQIFHAHVIERMPVLKVTRMLGTNAAKVYVVKHRLGSMLKKAIREVGATRN